VLRAPVALLLVLSVQACGATRKPFGPREDLTRDTYGYFLLPDCREEPSDWPEVRATKIEAAFDIQLRGLFTGSADRVQELIALEVFDRLSPGSCPALTEEAPIQVRIVTTHGARWAERPALDPALGEDPATQHYIGGKRRWMSARQFCYEVPMRADVRSIELVDRAGLTLVVLKRPEADTPRVRIAVDDAAAAVSYDGSSAPFSIADMRVENDAAVCSRKEVAQRTSSGFLGLGRSCWSYWGRHFETPDEVDPAMNHFEFFYRPGEKGGASAVLVVSDHFRRWTFPLPFTADCRMSK
jgi:hypothetical protein